MRRFEVVIVNRLGLHARAAARWVHATQGFASRIRVGRRTADVDGKSILGLLTLAAAKGTRLRVSVEGTDEAAAAETIAGLVRSGFGEDE